MPASPARQPIAWTFGAVLAAGEVESGGDDAVSVDAVVAVVSLEYRVTWSELGLRGVVIFVDYARDDGFMDSRPGTDRPMPDLHGKIALVTRGASGLGHATARRLQADGATGVITDIQVGLGEAAATESGCTFPPQDVTAEADRL